MNVSWLTLRDLEYLVAVAEHLHFGKAAQTCHVSQPALSAQIKKMEDFLGFPLFERTHRKVTLTDQGKLISDQARVILEEAEKLVSIARQSGSTELQGSLRLGVIATLGPYYVPLFLSNLKKQFPKLQLILREGLTDPLLSDLKSGSLDAVLAARTFDESGFRVFPIFKEAFVLAAPKEHELAGKDPLLASDLHTEDMVLLEDGHCLRDQTLEICPPNRRGNIRQFHATSVETLKHLVASGMGYTLLPELAIRDGDPMKDLLTYRRFGSQEVGRTIVLVCRKRYARMTEIEKLAEFLQKIAPKKVQSEIST
ncbi:MAG TPA: LysR substrate-binding domain-containing protein [Acidobacteriota bacterium]